MNTLKYDEESIGKEWLFFIGIFIVIFFLCILLVDAKYMIVPIIFISIFFLIFAFGMIKNTIESKNKRKEYKIIKKNGQKSDGRILKVIQQKKQLHSYFEEYKSITEQYVMVEYTDPQTQKIKTYITPDLSFNPFRALGSRTCSVYTYHNKIYVTNFVKRKLGQKNIWTKEEIDSMLYGEDPELACEGKKLMNKVYFFVGLMFIVFIIFVFFYLKWFISNHF